MNHFSLLQSDGKNPYSEKWFEVALIPQTWIYVHKGIYFKGKKYQGNKQP